MAQAKEIKLTIGLPVYNAEPYLRLSLKSILRQSYKDWKLFIINDGSNDGSDRVIQSFLHDKRITYINDVHKGLAFRLNQLSRLADTPYYARMDADDVMFPDRLQIQMEYLMSHPGVDLVGTSIIVIGEKNEIIGKRAFNSGLSNSKNLSLRWLRSIAHPTIVGKSEWFKANPYRRKYFKSEDTELWIRTHRITNFHNIEIPLLFYRDKSVNIRHYVVSKRMTRCIFKEQRHMFSSQLSYRYAVVLETLKSLIYRLFGMIGLQNYLVRQRSSRLGKSKKEVYQKLLREVKGSKAIISS